MPGSFYFNQALNGGAESLCIILSFFMNKYLNQRKSLIIAFVVCSVACGLVMIAEISEVTAIIPIGVIGGKGGITIAFNFFYFITVDYFEPHYLGLVMGIANFVGRLSTVLAPAIAEIDEPVPMLTCIVICVLAGIMSLQLKQPESFKKAKEVVEKKQEIRLSFIDTSKKEDKSKYFIND